LPKKNTVVLLRWVLIIAFSYLLILDNSVHRVAFPLVILIAVALGSNLVVGRLPEHWTSKALFDFGIVLFDAAWVTLGLIWAPQASSDLFLLYFLVIFIAAMGESLVTIVGSAALVSAVYGYTLTAHSGTQFHLGAGALLRVPFLFVVALFYGYFITEIRGRRNEATEAHLREQAKTELLAAVSHDLRGPLANVDSLLGLVLDEQDEGQPPDRDLLLRAQINVRRVTSLVTNLLEAACIESGQLHLQWVPVQVNDLVEDVFDLESGAALLRKIVLRRELDPHLPVISADPVQASRILANLVNNAIKYTDVGGTVVIRTRSDRETVSVSVQDTGKGMNATQCQALFAPYRRVHLGGYTQGKGLGLYIVKRLTESLGGQVQVSSESGVGSTFIVSLPRGHGSSEPPTALRSTRAAAETLAVRAETVGLPSAA